MRPLVDRGILDIWEKGQGLAPVDRALLMLAASGAGTVDALARLSIGRRDAALIRLRAATFGSRVDGLSDCPHCNEVLDVSFLCDDILVDDPAEETVLVIVGDYRVEARPATSADLVTVLSERSERDRESLLLARCIISASHLNRRTLVDLLPEEMLSEVEAALARSDPQAEVLLELACPSCGEVRRVPFDVVAFLWAEISARGARLLGEVHRLASAYGWSEAAILDLGPIRRRAYLEMVG